MLPNQGETINILPVVVGNLELQVDHSVLGFSHEMKVFHIDFIYTVEPLL